MADKKFYVEFGAWIHRRRKELGLNMAQLANISGVGCQTIRKIELYGNSCLAHTLLRLCWALEMDPRKVANMINYKQGVK